MADYGAVGSLVDVDELDNAADSAEPDFNVAPTKTIRVIVNRPPRGSSAVARRPMTVRSS